MNLLDGDITSQDVLNHSMAIARLSLDSPYCVLVVPLRTCKTNMDIIQQRLSSHTLRLETIRYNGDCIFLVYGKELQKSVKTITQALNKEKISFGVSNTFTKLILASCYYRQAQIAVELGAETQSGQFQYRFVDYVQVHLIRTALKHEQTEVFIHQGMEILLEYDQKQLTSYAETLHTFLKNFKNATKTAEQLHIHRNTLTYRLRKCEEIAQFHLEDEAVCRFIELSLDILLETQLNQSIRTPSVVRKY